MRLRFGVGVVSCALIVVFGCTGDDPGVTPTLEDAGGGSSGTSGSGDPDASAPRLTIAPVDEVFARIGAAVALPISVNRNTITGPLTVSFADLPDGALVKTATIAADASAVTLSIEVSGDAAQKVKATKLVVTTESGATTSADVLMTLRGAPGDVDTTFGKDGVVPVDTAFRTGVSLVSDASGAIYAMTGNAPGCFIHRFLPTGAIDTSFGEDGILPYTRPNIDGQCRPFLPLSDGKFLIAGTEGESSFLERVRATPTLVDGGKSWLDPTFANKGRRDIPHMFAIQLLLDPKGRLVVAGGADEAQSDSYGIRRLSQTGDLESGFAAVLKKSAVVGFNAEGELIVASNKGGTTNILFGHLSDAGALDDFAGKPAFGSFALDAPFTQAGSSAIVSDGPNSFWVVGSGEVPAKPSGVSVAGFALHVVAGIPVKVDEVKYRSFASPDGEVEMQYAVSDGAGKAYAVGRGVIPDKKENAILVSALGDSKFGNKQYWNDTTFFALPHFRQTFGAVVQRERIVVGVELDNDTSDNRGSRLVRFWR